MILRWALFFMLLSGEVRAQALVVSTCSTLPQSYVAGSTRSMTLDLNGNLCMTVSSPSAVCSTLPQAYAPGSTRNISIDVNGSACLQGGGGGGGGGGCNGVLDLSKGCIIAGLGP